MGDDGAEAIDHLDNVNANRQIWDAYAAKWTPELGFEARQSDLEPARYEHLGDEWGSPADVDAVVGEYIFPYVDDQSRVAEIGSGGGRVASRVVDRTGELWCFDISREMLEHAKDALTGHDNTRFVLLDAPRFAPELAGQFDFVYSFDVFVHLDLHTMWKYLQQFSLLLKPGGSFMIHTASVATEAGWAHFASQDRFRIPTHFFVSPETILTMLSHLPVSVTKQSREDPSNFYLARDFLVVCRRDQEGGSTSG